MPWTDTLAAVHMAPAMRPRSSDFSNLVEAARGAARQAGPSAPSPSPPKVTGRCASSWREECSEGCLGVGAGGGLVHEVQGVRLPRDVSAPLALARAPAQAGRRTERAPHPARPGWAARFLDSLGEDLGDSRPPGHTGQPKEPLVPR